MNPDGFEVSKEGTCDGGQGRYTLNFHKEKLSLKKINFKI